MQRYENICEILQVLHWQNSEKTTTHLAVFQELMRLRKKLFNSCQNRLVNVLVLQETSGADLGFLTPCNQ